eukprot:gene14750-606_t
MQENWYAAGRVVPTTTDVVAAKQTLIARYPEFKDYLYETMAQLRSLLSEIPDDRERHQMLKHWVVLRREKRASKARMTLDSLQQLQSERAP